MALVRICGEEEIAPGQAVRIVVDGVTLALAKDTKGVVHALSDTCSHGDISLSDGFVEGDSLECWAHGSRFELATGKPMNFPAFEPVAVFPVTIIDNDVYVDPEVSVLADQDS